MAEKVLRYKEASNELTVILQCMKRKKMSKRIKGLPPHWEEYILCVLMHMILPYLPLLFELIFADEHKISEKSLMLFSAMYPLSIGLSSNSKLMFGFSIVVSIFFSVAYGVVATGVSDTASNATEYAYFALCTIFIIHLLERYNRHVIDQTPFWDFPAGGANS